MKNIYSNIYSFNKKSYKKTIKALKKGNIVSLPTETVYGLAGNAYSQKSINKIFNLKKRPSYNPLIIHYHDLKKTYNDIILNEHFLKLYKKFSPGPITYILRLKKNSKISKNVTNNKNNLAVRFPKHRTFRKLLKRLDYPLAAPSANISTRLSAVQASDVKEEFGSKVKYILNGGKCNIGVESTIIDLIKKPEILRLGGLNITKIEKVLRKKINMDIGTIRATVKKQNTDFVIQTPTSVASVKGTDFWLITDPAEGDLIIGLEGIVGLTNSETGEEVDITEGLSGISTPDGELGVEETSSTSIPDDPSDDGEEENQIRIYLEGPNGEEKVMIIDYQ